MNIKENSVRDDENTPEADIPTHLSSRDQAKDQANAEPLPEGTRPRKDGPGGE